MSGTNAAYMTEYRKKPEAKIKQAKLAAAHYAANKPIYKKRLKDWRAANRERSRLQSTARERFRKFGVSLEQYNDMFSAQNGVCAICAQPETSLGRGGDTRTLAVDHDHVTNRVRGLLCYNCNTALGLVKDDANRLLTAAAYLMRYE
jgi:hypothetical protein